MIVMRWSVYKLLNMLCLVLNKQRFRNDCYEMQCSKHSSCRVYILFIVFIISFFYLNIYSMTFWRNPHMSQSAIFKNSFIWFNQLLLSSWHKIHLLVLPLWLKQGYSCHAKEIRCQNYEENLKKIFWQL